MYLEASRFEEKEGHIQEAIEICEDGLNSNMKFGPLWFQYLKLYEKASEELRQKKFDK